MKFVDLISFLRDFYGISNNSLSFKKIRHADINILFPFIKKCDVKSIDIDDICKGNIVGVYDKSGMIVYYINPRIAEVVYNILDEEDKDERYNVEIDIDNLSKDELLKLRRKLRKKGLREDALRVTKQIRKVKEDNKEYYKKLEKILIKERKNYD